MNLVALGPIVSTKWAGVRIGDIDVNVERWTVAELDFLELSIRVKRKDDDHEEDFLDRALRHQTRLLDVIAEVGLEIDTNPENKTRRVLTAIAAGATLRAD